MAPATRVSFADPLHKQHFADAAVPIRRCANADGIAARAGGAGVLDGTRPRHDHPST